MIGSWTCNTNITTPIPSSPLDASSAVMTPGSSSQLPFVMETAAVSHGPCAAGKRASTFFYGALAGYLFNFLRAPILFSSTTSTVCCCWQRDRTTSSALPFDSAAARNAPSLKTRGTAASAPTSKASWWVQTPTVRPLETPITHSTPPPLPPTMMTFATPVATLYTYIRKSRMNRPLSVSSSRCLRLSLPLRLQHVCILRYITCNPSELPAATLVAGDTCRTVMCFRGDGGWGG